jgi:hypothetical protein
MRRRNASSILLFISNFYFLHDQYVGIPGSIRLRRTKKQAFGIGLVGKSYDGYYSCSIFLIKFYIMKLKTLILLAGIAVLASCGGTYKATDQPSGVNVPASAQTDFTTRYGTAANVVWSPYDQVVVPIDWELAGWPLLETDDYVVQFDMDNEKYYAWYDSDGSWVGTAYVVNDYKTLPDPVSNTINTQFSGYTITGVSREFRQDKMAYEVELEKEGSKVKMLVDGDGTIIKQKEKAK